MSLDGFYEVISAGEDELIIQLSSKEHPIFKAHFPQNPILPAFIHLEIIAREFSREIKEIKKAKFTEVVMPDAIIHYLKDNNRFKIFVNKKQVASFSL